MAAATPVSRRPSGSHAPIMLLLAMLSASLLISIFTLRLLSTQDAMLQDAMVESDSQALALLANHVEHTLLGAVRDPFQALKNAATDDSVTERVQLAAGSSPEVRRILVLDRQMHQRHSWSRGAENDERQLEKWLFQHVAAEADKAGPVALHTLVEQMAGKPVLLALQAANAIDASDGWILMSFDLPALASQLLDPLLREFTHARGGQVELQDPTTPWDESALHQPLTRILPGWLLSYQPDRARARRNLTHSRYLLIGVSVSAVIALLLATYATWRELRRERALAALRNRFVANVSHEFKTPLALIRLYAETLYLDRLKDPRRRHLYVETILRDAERLTGMIDTVLDLEGLRRGQDRYRLTTLDLGATVTAAVEQYRETWRQRGAQVTVEVPAGLPEVAHDPRGITQILLNLLNNAVEHGGGGTIHLSLTSEGDWLDLAVSDHGSGLSRAELATLHRALRRGEAVPSRRGSGLGLALVDGIAAAHHGYMVLDTLHDGEGLRVVVSFPVHKGTTSNESNDPDH